MATEPKPPVLIKEIPAQIVNEGAVFGPFQLTDYIQSPNPESGRPTFTAELSDGVSLPKGLICTNDGMISGIPAKDTQGVYEIVVFAKNEAAEPFSTRFKLTIKERIELETPELLSGIKSRIWEALGKDLPLPDLGDIMNRPITDVEIYYLLQRFATLTIWDVYNLDVPGNKIPLTLEGVSQHYHIYDRGSCLVGCPKDLYSHERTLEDALRTARAMAKEVYKRGWVIEFAGFDKMVRAAWIELQNLMDQHGKKIEILHYSPSPEDIRTYSVQTGKKLTNI